MPTKRVVSTHEPPRKKGERRDELLFPNKHARYSKLADLARASNRFITTTRCLSRLTRGEAFHMQQQNRDPRGDLCVKGKFYPEHHSFLWNSLGHLQSNAPVSISSAASRSITLYHFPYTYDPFFFVCEQGRIRARR